MANKVMCSPGYPAPGYRRALYLISGYKLAHLATVRI